MIFFKKKYLIKIRRWKKLSMLNRMLSTFKLKKSRDKKWNRNWSREATCPKLSYKLEVLLIRLKTKKWGKNKFIENKILNNSLFGLKKEVMKRFMIAKT